MSVAAPFPALPALLLVVLTSAPVHAQESPTAPGVDLWWEVAAGAGASRLTCPICDPARSLGPNASLAVGAYANPRVRVGIDGQGWTNQDGGERESVFRAGVVMHLHPRPASGLHLIGGAGWSGYRSDEQTYDAVRLTLGAGWDLPLVGSWAVGNRLTVDASSFGSLSDDDTVVQPRVGLSVVQLAVYLRKR